MTSSVEHAAKSVFCAAGHPAAAVFACRLVYFVGVGNGYERSVIRNVCVHYEIPVENSRIFYVAVSASRLRERVQIGFGSDYERIHFRFVHVVVVFRQNNERDRSQFAGLFG